MYIIKRTKDQVTEYLYEIPLRYGWTSNRTKATPMNLMRAESKYTRLQDT